MNMHRDIGQRFVVETTYSDGLAADHWYFDHRDDARKKRDQDRQLSTALTVKITDRQEDVATGCNSDD